MPEIRIRAETTITYDITVEADDIETATLIHEATRAGLAKHIIQYIGSEK